MNRRSFLLATLAAPFGLRATQRPASILADVQAMIATLEADRLHGPWTLVLPEDFAPSGEVRYAMDKIPGLKPMGEFRTTIHWGEDR